MSSSEENCVMQQDIVMESSMTMMAPAHSKLVELHDTENDADSCSINLIICFSWQIGGNKLTKVKNINVTVIQSINFMAVAQYSDHAMKMLWKAKGAQEHI